jgi:hypothetical protein
MMKSSSLPSSNPHPYAQLSRWSRFFHRYKTIVENLIRTYVDNVFVYRSSWISSLLIKSGKQRAIQLPDLYDLLPELESKTLTESLEKNWFDEVKRCPQSPSLIRATIRTMGWAPLLIGLLLIPNVGQANFIHMRLNPTMTISNNESIDMLSFRN